MTAPTLPTEDAEQLPVIFVATREYQVLRAFLFDGATNKVIGHRLWITEDTVKTHMRRIFAKLKVNDRVQLAIKVYGREIDVVTVTTKGLGIGATRHLWDDLIALRRAAVIDTTGFTS